MQKQNHLTECNTVLELSPSMGSCVVTTSTVTLSETPIPSSEPNPCWVAFFAEALRLAEVARERRQAILARQEQENAERESLSDAPGDEIRPAQSIRQHCSKPQRKSRKASTK